MGQRGNFNFDKISIRYDPYMFVCFFVDGYFSQMSIHYHPTLHIRKNSVIQVQFDRYNWINSLSCVALSSLVEQCCRPIISKLM